ncbi:MAG: glycosyltransferase family 2 protein [SAR324 cluster bacterium]|nr:glycosyltransferase family 2 protein [SAR324 cluster bacterium]
MLDRNSHPPTCLSGWIGCCSLLAEAFDEQTWSIDIRYAFGSEIFKQHLIDFLDFNLMHNQNRDYSFAKKKQKLILYICADDLEFPNSYTGFNFTKLPYSKEKFFATNIWHPIPEHYLSASNYQKVYRGLVAIKFLSSDLANFFYSFLNTNLKSKSEKFSTTRSSLNISKVSNICNDNDAVKYTLPRNTYRKAEGGRRLLLNDSNLTKKNLTVITIVFNNVEFIEQTIQSVINQQGNGLEYILIDGGSTDGTVELIQKYNEHLTYWISEPDRGISHAFNKALLLSKNSWLNFMNSGDYFIRFDILSLLEKHSEQNILTGFCRSDGFSLPSKNLTNQLGIASKAKLSHQASFIKKNIFTMYGSFNEYYYSRMDYQFWMRVLPHEKFYFIKQYIAYYQKTGESNKNLVRMYKEELIINSKFLPTVYFLRRLFIIVGSFLYKLLISRYR